MRTDTFTVELPSPLAIGEGTPIDVEDLDQLTLFISGTLGDTTLNVYVSADGTAWAGPINAAPLAVNAALSLEKMLGGRFRAKEIRVDVVAHTSGVPVVQLMGRNLRTE